MGIGELVEDDFELMGADDEDNFLMDDTDDDSVSLTGRKSGLSGEEEAEF